MQIHATTDIKGAKNVLNFFSQAGNWEEILEEALEDAEDTIKWNASYYLNQGGFEARTGRLVRSINVEVDGTELIASVDHPAASLIEFGGYITKVDARSPTIIEYAKIYGITPFALRRGILKNQPFMQVTFFLGRALGDAKDEFAVRTRELAKKRADKF